MSTGLSRREVLGLALASPLVAAASSLSRSIAQISDSFTARLELAPWRVIAVDPSTNVDEVVLQRDWRGALCSSRLMNRGSKPVAIKEVVLLDVPHRFSPDTKLYGEGFQMLTQTGGSLGQPIKFSQYTDEQHYKLPAPADARVFYGMMTLSTSTGTNHLVAFTSCRRFSGKFYLRDSSLQAVIDTEGLVIKPGETWQLEEFTYRKGSDRDILLALLGSRLEANHPTLQVKSPPTGWCSWYCFGPRVTAQQVLDNLDFIAKNAPQLRYIQIDDGYQSAMGDWLETGNAFGGNVQGVLKQIRARGFEPAIWVAPFVAEEKSNLFQQHQDWFVKDADGNPLRSDRVTFGGWRRGPWYVLDGTHPQAQQHLEKVFRTMRKEWGCTYFKLDANFWGAIHGGRFRDQSATRIEAYRRGMRAILKGADDGFVLGCNHPLWPSLGLIHGSRSSNDIKRTWDRIKTTARQNLSRNWQNGRLWWNDPDAICLSGDLPIEEFKFHATAIFASGGMVLSGDDLTRISPDRLEMLKKLLPPTGVAAEFADDSLAVGFVKHRRSLKVCLFNWDDAPATLKFRLPRRSVVTDYWTGESFGIRRGEFTVTNMPPHSARLLQCE
ncbi:MAG TPA: glycoside hydrolase family 36 protein [Pyrinomonadaceae bacterium]|nr:glycoside hydrolase family 36 protein [Pyrinomonadaceae bacterium]